VYGYPVQFQPCGPGGLQDGYLSAQPVTIGAATKVAYLGLYADSIPANLHGILALYVVGE
jgi:hypothetical protein